MGRYYDIDGNPIERMEWVAMVEGDNDGRRVARETVGEYDVSTVFLGLDHGWGEGPPLIFETMVFGPDTDGEFQWRYSTKEQALAGHARVVAAIQAGALTPDLAVGT